MSWKHIKNLTHQAETLRKQRHHMTNINNDVIIFTNCVVCYFSACQNKTQMPVWGDKRHTWDRA